jgi:uncharacterized membrane protein
MNNAQTPSDLFPHERVVFFSDAVFAIAMTLLAIELRTPSQELIERIGADRAWGEIVPLFVAFIVSFLVTGLFWMAHLQTWKQISRATGKLVWCTVLQLMFIALMPFAARLYSEAFNSHSPGRFAFYSFVMAASSFFAWLNRRLAVKQENLHEKLGAAQARWFQLRSLVSLAVFAAGIPLAFVLPVWAGGYLFALIFPLTSIVRRLCFRTAGMKT